MQEITWRGAAPQFLDFQSHIETYPDIAPLPFEVLQPRLQQSLSHLSLGEHFSRLLLLNAPDLPLYYQLILEMLRRSGQETIINAALCDEAQLFGAVHPNIADPLQPHCTQGALHRAHNGILLLSIAQLIDNPHWLPKIKNILTSKMLAWPSATGKQFCPTPAPLPCDVRIILFGDDLYLAELSALEPALFELSLFAHFEQEIELSSATLSAYLSFIKQLQQQQQLKPLTVCAAQKLLQVGTRRTEAQNLAPLCPAWLSHLLEQADFYSQNNVISGDDISRAYEKRRYCSGYLAQRALEDIHQGYVFIETSGTQIGQVNGLTVLDLPGHPAAYGEPARISCVVHYGDGEITDVERKVELGGNIHAKGMMIMQAFLHSALQLTDVLPYSASIVFEQSYCEVDGDSASLAELCAFVSALAKQPIAQSIAVTGAVDQHGRVHAVGGINEKIEGFFAVCEKRGLTGTQGVILPKANLPNLCLNSAVVNAIKNGEFHLWAVDRAQQAFPLLMELEFSCNDHGQETLLSKIADRIAAEQELTEQSASLLSRLKNWFKNN